MSDKPLLDYQVRPQTADPSSVLTLPPALWVVFALMVGAGFAFMLMVLAGL